MTHSKRPPTEGMIRKLRKCLASENENKFFLAEEMKSSLPGLYRRGLIITKMENLDNKRLLCIYVSEKGKELLTILDAE